jgi:hypothetical protein
VQICLESEAGVMWLFPVRNASKRTNAHASGSLGGFYISLVRVVERRGKRQFQTSCEVSKKHSKARQTDARGRFCRFNPRLCTSDTNARLRDDHGILLGISGVSERRSALNNQIIQVHHPAITIEAQLGCTAVTPSCRFFSVRSAPCRILR